MLRKLDVLLAVLVAMLLGGAASVLAAPLETAKVGDTLTLAGKQVTVKEIDITPVLKNEYSAVFDFDSFDQPELKELRDKYELAKVIAAGKDEFDKQVLLCAWVNEKITFGPPKSDPKTALKILQAAAAGEQFNCGYFALTLAQAARSLGWVVRDIGLKGAKGDGNGSEHSVCEIWSNQYRKWVMFDPTSRMYIEKNARPLSAFEIRQEWFYNHAGKELTFVLGAQRKKYALADLPIALGTFKGFGPLSVNPQSIGKFLIILYIPTTKTGGPDYTHMFIVKDKLADGVETHTRKNPADPANEAYWPMNQAALQFTPTQAGPLKIEAHTATPDFANYRSRLDGKDWSDGLPENWTLHPGTNTLEALTLNKFGTQGIPSKLVLEVK